MFVQKLTYCHHKVLNKLCNNSFNDEENLKKFGKCLRAHGHNARLIVTVEGKEDEETEMVINFVDLKKIIEEEILDKFDHQFFNDLPEMEGKVPTAEATVKIFWKLLNPRLTTNTYHLHSLRFYETDTSWIDYNGE